MKHTNLSLFGVFLGLLIACSAGIRYFILFPDTDKGLFLFDFNDGEQIIDAFSPENHQWLTAEENLKKSTHTQVNYTGGK